MLSKAVKMSPGDRQTGCSSASRNSRSRCCSTLCMNLENYLTVSLVIKHRQDDVLS